MNGFKIFSLIVHCPETTFKLYQFLDGLLSSESLRTIIKATVNTIQSDDIKGTNKKMVNEFYLALNHTFDFQYGKILLATSTFSKLKTMMEKDWPYFTPYSQEIKQCLSGASCQGIINIVSSSGNKL